MLGNSPTSGPTEWPWSLTPQTPLALPLSHSIPILISAAATRDLVCQILPPRLQPLPTLYEEDALSLWSSGHNIPPSGAAACVQKSWDAPLVSNAVDLLLQNAPHDVARARLLAVSAKESGAWLKALPVSSLGLRMDDRHIWCKK